MNNFRYQRGQALVVQTENYGAFAGMILAMCEQYIQFRSTVPGGWIRITAFLLLALCALYFEFPLKIERSLFPIIAENSL